MTGYAAQVAPFTKSSPARIAAMVEAIDLVERDDIAGDIVECGVWRGGNIILARKMAPDRVCWLYDTFEGMTEPGPFDVKGDGKTALSRFNTKKSEGRDWDKVTLDEVRENLQSTGTLDDAKLRFVVGPCERTLLDAANLPEQIAVLRLDTDWYISTKVELEMLYPRLMPGGVLIVDDYGHWMGAQRAVREYFGGGFAYKSIDYTAISLVKGC